LFVGIGAAALLASRDYALGSAVRMGPGYFPTWVGAITVLLGAIIALRSLKLEGQEVTPFDWRALVLLALGFGFFGWAIERLGLVASLAVLIVLSALGGREFRLGEVAILAVVLIALCGALFVYALGLPMRLWW
jgi:hypothetical protein